MVFPTDEVTKEALRVARGHDENAEAEVHDVDRATLVKLPAVAGAGGEGHLSRGGDEVPLSNGHQGMILGAQTLHTRYRERRRTHGTT